MNRFAGLIVRHRWASLILLLGATLLAAAQVVDPRTGNLRLEFDPSIDALLPEGDEEVEFYREMREKFGGDETMIVALSADDSFTAENLRRVKRLTERLEIEHVHRVLSLATAVTVSGTKHEIYFETLLDEIPEDPAGLAEIRRRVLRDPFYSKNLISSDGRTTAIVLYFNEYVSSNLTEKAFIESDIDEQIRRIAEEEAGDLEVFVTGSLHVNKARHRLFFSDLWRAMPLILLVLVLVLAYAFRTPRGVLIPIASVVAALTWTLGVTAALGRPLHLVTGLIPPLLLILGLSYTMHVISAYYRTARDEPEASHPHVIREAIARVWLPVALTGLTTGAGFLAIGANPGVPEAVRDFGLLALLGVAATVIASLTVPPTLMALLGRPAQPPPGRQRDDRAFDRFVGFVARFDLEHKVAIRITAAGVLVVACVAATQMRIGGSSIGNFPADSRVRTDFEAINERLSGASRFSIVLQVQKPSDFCEPAVLREVEDLQQWLDEQPEIGSTTSLVDYVKVLNQATHGDDPNQFQIPRLRRPVCQIFFFWSSPALDGLLDLALETTSIGVRTTVTDNEEIADLRSRIEGRLEELPPTLRGRVTGNVIVVEHLFEQIAEGQAYSLVSALVLIYLVLWFLFTNWFQGLVALIPNILPVAVFFGALGVSGVRSTSPPA